MAISILLFSHSVMSISFATPWTVALQAPLSMEFPRQEYWSGLPFPSPGDLLDPGIDISCIEGEFFTTEPPGKHAIKKKEKGRMEGGRNERRKEGSAISCLQRTANQNSNEIPRMAKIQTTANTKSCQGCGATGTLTCWLVGMQNGPATLENLLVVSYKTTHTLSIQSSNWGSWCLCKGVEQLYLYEIFT